MHELFIDHKNGEFEQLCVKLKKYPEKFYNYFLCSIQTFDYILKEIIEHVIKYSMFHDVISPKERLAITLRYVKHIFVSKKKIICIMYSSFNNIITE